MRHMYNHIRPHMYHTRIDIAIADDIDEECTDSMWCLIARRLSEGASNSGSIWQLPTKWWKLPSSRSSPSGLNR